MNVENKRVGGMEEEGDTDPWLGLDKLYHFAFCFSLSFLFYSFASLSPFPFFRRHAIFFAALASLLAGAAKELADHLGYFHSSGASLRDALADLLGVIIASFALSLFPSQTHPPRISPV